MIFSPSPRSFSLLPRPLLCCIHPSRICECSLAPPPLPPPWPALERSIIPFPGMVGWHSLDGWILPSILPCKLATYAFSLALSSDSCVSSPYAQALNVPPLLLHLTNSRVTFSSLPSPLLPHPLSLPLPSPEFTPWPSLVCRLFAWPCVCSRPRNVSHP